jgi:hypothetical protein
VVAAPRERGHRVHHGHPPVRVARPRQVARGRAVPGQAWDLDAVALGGEAHPERARPRRVGREAVDHDHPDGTPADPDRGRRTALPRDRHHRVHRSASMEQHPLRSVGNRSATRTLRRCNAVGRRVMARDARRVLRRTGVRRGAAGVGRPRRARCRGPRRRRRRGVPPRRAAACLDAVARRHPQRGHGVRSGRARGGRARDAGERDARRSARRSGRTARRVAARRRTAVGTRLGLLLVDGGRPQLVVATVGMVGGASRSPDSRPAACAATWHGSG